MQAGAVARAVQGAPGPQGDDGLGDEAEQRLQRVPGIVAAGECRRLVLVGHDEVDGLQQFGGQRRRRGRGQDHLGAGRHATRNVCRGDDGVHRQLQLQQQRVGPGDGFRVPPGGAGDRAVRAGHHDDRVVSAVLHDDVRDARRAGYDPQPSGVHARLGERGPQPRPERVVPHGPEEGHAGSRAGRGDRLVGPLAAGNRAKLPARDGLPGLGAWATYATRSMLALPNTEITVGPPHRARACGRRATRC
ncbi:hypothetical protein GCM10027612_62440 [Microbispora bryophytorum subsp. camponoti]